jgi:type IV secretion system protein TrbG
MLFPPSRSKHGVTTYRTPFEMALARYSQTGAATPPPVAEPQTPGDQPEVPLQRPLPAEEPTAPDASEPTPEEIIDRSREQATQRPSATSFINAVQVYQFDPGAVYEVFAAPTFVTMLHLRPGEELRQVTAGDTSRWLVDIVEAGDADAHALGFRSSPTRPNQTRIAVIIKPRFPGIRTNMIISTNERIYLIDLKSLEETYHSAVAWTYPQPMRAAAPTPKSNPYTASGDERNAGNYVYALQAPPGGLPPWAPHAVYDDGHRVYIEFPPSINDHERPPLFLLDSDGIARMVNYRSEPNRYVVDQLFDRAALRIGRQRVVIQRTLPRPSAPNGHGTNAAHRE